MNSSQLKLVPESGNKKCNKCVQIKLISEFCKASRNKDGLCSQCKTCHSAMNKIHWDKNREKYLAQKKIYSQTDVCKKFGREKAWEHYGILNADGSKFKVHDYEVMFAQQNGKCAICETTDTRSKRNKHLYVDHNHKTGFVRWLLCNYCNQLLARANDDPKLLRKAADMLEAKS